MDTAVNPDVPLYPILIVPVLPTLPIKMSASASFLVSRAQRRAGPAAAGPLAVIDIFSHCGRGEGAMVR